MMARTAAKKRASKQPRAASQPRTKTKLVGCATLSPISVSLLLR